MGIITYSNLLYKSSSSLVSRYSLVNFSFGLGNSFDEYVHNLPAGYQKPVFIVKPLGDVPISSINNLNSYYATIQFTPFSNILIWVKRTLNKAGIAYYTMPNLRSTLKDEIRIEYELRNLGFFTASWDRRTSKKYPTQSDYNIYFEWNKPWSALLRTKLHSNYRLDKTDYGNSRYMDNSEFKINLKHYLDLLQTLDHRSL